MIQPSMWPTIIAVPIILSGPFVLSAVYEWWQERRRRRERAQYIRLVRARLAIDLLKL
jgi:hypothetical protein